MTVAELIAELQLHPPGKPVRLVMSPFNVFDEAGEYLAAIEEADAQEADDVRNEGAFVLIRAK
jgi:hypothetical protein